MRLPFAATLLLLGVTACGTAAPTAANPTQTPTVAAIPTATTPTTPAPTDGVGKPIIRPNCAALDGGSYVHASGPSRITPVLLLGSGNRGVVVGAQANGHICQLLPVARALVAKGYHVAIFDWTDPFAEAMTTAAQALITDGATKVVLGGFSRGALVALGVAESVQLAVGVFSISGGPSAPEGFPTIESLATFHGPLLLVASETDPVFPVGTCAAIAAAHKGEETVLLLPGSSHALALLNGVDGNKVWTALDDFLARVLG